MPSILPFSCLTLCLFISTFNAALERNRRRVEAVEEKAEAMAEEEVATVAEEEAIILSELHQTRVSCAFFRGLCNIFFLFASLCTHVHFCFCINNLHHAMIKLYYRT